MYQFGGVNCIYMYRPSCWSFYVVIYIKCNSIEGLCEQLTKGVHENRAHFSKMINFRGHMPQFTVRMNVFPSMS